VASGHGVEAGGRHGGIRQYEQYHAAGEHVCEVSDMNLHVLGAGKST
jgi:hypothetical protein